MNLVMHGADVIRSFLSRYQIRGAFKSDRKRMELRPPGGFPAVCFNAFFAVFLRDCSDNRRIQTTAEQHSIRNIAHKLGFYGRFKAVADFFYYARVYDFALVVCCTGCCFYAVKTFPFAVVPADWFTVVFTPEITSVREFFYSNTVAFKCFKFACNIVAAGFVPSLIKWNDSDFITAYKVSIAF